MWSLLFDYVHILISTKGKPIYTQKKDLMKNRNSSILFSMYTFGLFEVIEQPISMVLKDRSIKNCSFRI